ncbi:MAG: DUF5667 domain-containing protein [Patescibacteria group bacterium]
MKIKTAIVSLLFVPFLVFAQNGALPGAGLTPESPFYFIDKLGEALREFFTFSPEGKAHLQIAFAAERVAEIKIVLETKGVDAKGLEVAEARLRKHLGDAAEIVIKQKNKGKDVSQLAKELNDNFEESKSALSDSFKAEKKALEAKEDDLKNQIKAARRVGDNAKVEALAQELGQVKAQLELLELKEEELEDDLDKEEEKLEDEMDAYEEAEEAIREAKEEKAEIIEEAQEEGLELPANTFAAFDNLLTQAESAYQAGNYQEAERLAEQAEDTIENIEDVMEELEKQKEELEDEEKENENEENDTEEDGEE